SINFRAGAVNGWDNFNSVNDDAWSYIGGADWTSADGATSLTLASVVGNVVNDDSTASVHRWVYSVVATHDFSDSLHLLIQHDQGEDEDSGVVTANWYGVNSYLTYDVSDSIGVAVRGEWFQDGNRVGNGQADYYAITGGVNYHVNNWLKIRPEIRYDWSEGVDAFDGTDDQFLVSIDTVIAF
ncbi:MAG: outer membrane beta-barrel protein, partial [Methylococcales bacterium]